MSPCLTLSPSRTTRLLVDAGVLVRPLELEQPVDLAAQLLVLDGDVVAVDLGDGAVVLGEDHVGRVAGGAGLDAGADVGGLGPHQRHGLLLHVGAHEGPVGVVVLEERDERGGHRDDLLRRDVHELDLVAAAPSEISVVAPKNTSRSSCSFRSPSDGGLRASAARGRGPRRRCRRRRAGALAWATTYSSSSSAARYTISSVTLPLMTLRYGDSMKPNGVDPGEGGQGADEADVRALRRLDRAHAAVVGEVDVADLEAGPLTGQATRAERREATAVGEARQRVHLVHELRELAGAEELLDGGDHRPDVDERLGRDGLDVLGGHALADDPLHAGQADADLVLDQLADRADAAVGEVVLVVEAVARLAR